MKTLDNASSIIILSSLIFYCYLLDPFRWKTTNRNHRKLLVRTGYAKVIYTISFLLFFAGLVKVFFNDSYTIAFASIPLMFICLTKAAHGISLRYYKRKFFLILRGDSTEGKTLFQVAASTLVIVLPIFIPILYLLVSRITLS